MTNLEASLADVRKHPAGAGIDALKSVLGRISIRTRPLRAALLIASILVATGCTVWAVYDGASLPVALMCGYSTVMAGVALFVALSIAPAQEAKIAPVQNSRQQPNYAAWKLVDKLNVSNASRLWCDIEPGHPYTQESAAWASAMLDAIKSGALPFCAKPRATAEMTAKEKANPGWNTEVTREALKTWALAHGHCPAFLRD